ncbi:MAG: penicillin-binding protein 2, partial [Chloroflexi bacterium]|nr:penicillin-binding protein 2 [Chloroflexota bacterium]
PRPAPVQRVLRTRALVSAWLLVAVFSYLTWKLWYWQFPMRATLEQRGRIEHTLDVAIPASRGHIYDATGQTLATNAQYWLIYAIPPNITDPVGTALTLAPILGVPQQQLIAAFSRYMPGSMRKRMYSVLARKVPPKIERQIVTLHLPGIGWRPDETRIYPGGTLAAQVLGFVDNNGNGQYGLEQEYNKLLKGKEGHRIAIRDALGQELDLKHAQVVPPVRGSDLYLTINGTIQYDAEQVLAEGIKQYGATSGSIVVLDPNTGAILAMANYPTFDPNHFGAANPAAFTNSAIWRPFEPGSTFKIVTMSIGIQDGRITPETTVYDPGYVRLYNSIIRDWDRKPHGVVTMRQVLDDSLNVGASFVARRLGPKLFYEGLASFHIGMQTGVDLPNEASGSVLEPGSPGWYPINLLTNSFGQGLMTTPLQMADIAAAIANGGTLYRPYVVQRIVGPDGEKVTHPQVIGHPISPQTAATLRSMMAEVVRIGEANLGQIPGYVVAGKTGTAQIAKNGVYEPKTSIASFVGFAPVNHPVYVIYVDVYHPTSSIYGALTATPMAARLGQMILTYMGIPPTAPYPTPTPHPSASRHG